MSGINSIDACIFLFEKHIDIFTAFIFLFQNSLKMAYYSFHIEEKLINVSYKLIYAYSLCQIQYNKLNNYIIMPFMKSLQFTGTPAQIVTEELSNIKFFMIEIEYNNNKYTIEFNYWVVNATLGEHFFKYYLKNILHVELKDEDPFDYKVTILDHNVKLITLSPEQSIVLGKNDYVIYPIKEKEEKEEEVKNEVKEEGEVKNEEKEEEIKDNVSDKSDDFVNLELQ
jgi:hypothetical protein